MLASFSLHTLTWCIFIRESEPRYGLYILNRAGPDDYIQYIYPEDDLALPSATLVSYRIYPEYTAKRLSDPAWAAEVQAKAASAPWVDGKPPDPNAQKTKVGTSKMLGFWIILDKEGRNPIHDALVRCAPIYQTIFRRNSHVSVSGCMVSYLKVNGIPTSSGRRQIAHSQQFLHLTKRPVCLKLSLDITSASHVIT